MAAQDGLLELVLDAAAHHRSRPAMLIEGVPRSYDWLIERAGRVAATLATLGERGDRCAVLGRRSTLSYVAFLGILGAGQVYVPLSPHDPAMRQATKLTQAGVRFLIVDPSCLGLLKPMLAHLPRPPMILAVDSTRADVLAAGVPEQTVILSANDFTGEHDLATIAMRCRGSDPAYLLFTSGSTGKQKGVAVPRSAVQEYVVEMRDLLGTHAEDRFSQGFDPGFDLAIHDMMVCWSSGACLVPLPEFKLRYLDDVRRQGITVWFSIPSSISLAERTGQLKPGALPSLRLSLFCGEALMARDARAWHRAAANSRVYNLYGPTEATIAVSVYDATDREDPEAIVSIGVPFAGNRFHLLDPETGEITREPEGELAIGGTQLAIGYWGDPDLTSRRFPAVRAPDGEAVRVYRTGDRARIDATGNYHFLGRLDNEVKIHGYRISPVEVEAEVVEAAEASMAVVVERSPGKLSPVDLVAFVAGSRVGTEEILRRCRERLPNYMWPAEVRSIDEYPRLANGKIDRRALTALATSEFAT